MKRSSAVLIVLLGALIAIGAYKALGPLIPGGNQTNQTPWRYNYTEINYTEPDWATLQPMGNWSKGGVTLQAVRAFLKAVFNQTLAWADENGYFPYSDTGFTEANVIENRLVSDVYMLHPVEWAYPGEAAVPQTYFKYDLYAWLKLRWNSNTANATDIALGPPALLKDYRDNRTPDETVEWGDVKKGGEWMWNMVLYTVRDQFKWGGQYPLTWERLASRRLTVNEQITPLPGQGVDKVVFTFWWPGESPYVSPNVIEVYNKTAEKQRWEAYWKSYQSVENPELFAKLYWVGSPETGKWETKPLPIPSIP